MLFQLGDVHLVVNLALSFIVLRIPQLLLDLLDIVCFLVELTFAELVQSVVLVLHELEVSLQLLCSLTQFRYLCFALPARLANCVY